MLILCILDPTYAGLIQQLITPEIPTWWEDVENLQVFEKVCFQIFNKVIPTLFNLTYFAFPLFLHLANNGFHTSISKVILLFFSYFQEE